MDRLNEALKTFIAIKRNNNRLNDAVKKDVSNHNLNVNEFTVLEVLYSKGPQRIQQIKERILIANSSTTYIIDKLVDKNYVERTCDESDRRIYYAQLTPSGQKLMEEIFPDHEQMILRLFDNLDDNELLELKRLLRKLNNYDK